MKTDPRIYLGIDNCFASKRWTNPSDWMNIIKDLGLLYVEASADTECDPLYMGPEYTHDWIDEVKRCSEKTGVVVKNLYSGHGTYATLGLSHTDERVRRRFRDEWMKVQVNTANALGAGLGFYAHAFDDTVLQSQDKYKAKLEELYDILAELAEYAAEIGMRYISVEQMYSPHQPPWTVEGAKTLMKKTYARANAPFYITIDLGHINGQQYFQKPTEKYIAECIEKRIKGDLCKRTWLGSKKAMDLYYSAIKGKIHVEKAISRIMYDVEQNPHLFAAPEDGNIYNWVEKLACYSPIMHLQQSDGKSSPHWPFSPEYNANGVIDPEKILKSITVAYEQDIEMGMPEKCTEIVLTLEAFISTAGNNYDALEELKQSVAYWRHFVPSDGIRLSELVK